MPGTPEERTNMGETIRRVYFKKDGRVFVELKSGKLTSYARFKMERHLGRKLGPDEEVDHIDDDRSNNHISNLQVLTPAENQAKSNHKGWTDCICPTCGVSFQAETRRIKFNQTKRGYKGPYCSRHCFDKR